MGLTARERFTLTLNHQDPGRVVLDLGATPISGIHGDALYRLRRDLHLDEHPIKINEPLQLLGEVEDDLLEALSIDIIGVTNNMTMFGFENTGWKPWKLQSGLDVLIPQDFNTTVDEEGLTYLYPMGDMKVRPAARMPKGGYFFDNITRVTSGFDEDNADARHDFKDDFAVYTDEQLRFIEERCNYLYRNTEYGLIGGGALAGFGDFALVPGPNVKYPEGIRDLADFMVAHYTMPEYIHDLYGMQLEIALKNAELFYQAAGNKIQAMQISGTDFGMQTGPYMSPDSYREFYMPYHKSINEWVHQNTQWKTFYHTCGSIVDFLPDFANAGIDILNPVQTSAAGMDPRMLKEKWGDVFVFWGGGISTQKTLPFGSADEVYAEAMQTLEIFSKSGGYVCNTIHNIQANTPTENILAFFKAIRDFNTAKSNN
jgi:Uroporphyrinogen-III decarboxylase